MRKVIVVLSVLLILCFILTGCHKENEDLPVQTYETTESIAESETAETAKETHEQEMGILSSFSTMDLNGSEVTPDIFKDHKLTMINVWATYCGYCIVEMPYLTELGEEYADDGFQIVGFVTDVIKSDGTLDEAMVNSALEIVADTGADYTHIVPEQSLYGLLAQISSLPTTFFVDSNGVQVGNAYLGMKDKESWKTIIEETLKLVE